MQVEALVQLIGSGNFQTVEDEWLAALDDDQTTPHDFAGFVPVLDALVKAGKSELAETLALTAVETLRERFEPGEVLVAARAMLLSLSRCTELRGQVLELYGRAGAGRPGIERLIEVSGLSGSRPSRRAVRTLDVCLALSPGSYLVGRHGDGPARVEQVDEQTWQITIRTPAKTIILDPTELADTYEPADATDYRVLWHFDPERLAARIEDDPVPVVTGIVRAHSNRLSRDALEEMLSPRFIPPDRWSQWWSKTRAKLKRMPNLRVEGRSPYVIVYDPRGRTLEEETLERFEEARDPAGYLSLLATYRRECRSRKVDPDAGLLLTMAQSLEEAAERQKQRGGTLVLSTLLVAGRARKARGEESFNEKAIALLAEVDDPAEYVRAVEPPELWISACECLEAARPEQVVDLFAELLRVAPPSACDHLAGRMVACGCPPERFDVFVREVLREPIRHFRALCWLWTGPSHQDVTRSVTPLTLLNRILASLADLRRDDRIDPQTVRTMRAEARAALSARKYERFAACLDTISAGMASTLSTQIARLDSLGKTVHADLLRMIRARFPALHARPRIEPWADESVLYVTETGLAAKEAEVDELVNVKMAENARAIGQAAERGDLSENSEYKFALEERDLLRARLARMNHELAMARVLSPDDVPETHVGIGNHVTLRHAQTGRRKELVLLGPWEANAEKNIVNYQAPVAQALLGARPGDTVELSFADPPGAYVIESLGNALMRSR